jgi:hypothetical protein
MFLRLIQRSETEELVILLTQVLQASTAIAMLLHSIYVSQTACYESKYYTNDVPNQTKRFSLWTVITTTHATHTNTAE